MFTWKPDQRAAKHMRRNAMTWLFSAARSSREERLLYDVVAPHRLNHCRLSTWWQPRFLQSQMGSPRAVELTVSNANACWNGILDVWLTRQAYFSCFLTPVVYRYWANLLAYMDVMLVFFTFQVEATSDDPVIWTGSFHGLSFEKGSFSPATPSLLFSYLKSWPEILRSQVVDDSSLKEFLSFLQHLSIQTIAIDMGVCSQPWSTLLVAGLISNAWIPSRET